MSEHGLEGSNKSSEPGGKEAGALLFPACPADTSGESVLGPTFDL